MKRRFAAFAGSLLLTAALFSTAAYALNYSGSQENEATFETLEEARESGPAAVQNLETNGSKTFISHPVLDGIPEGTVFVYRSPNMYGGRAAARLNTNILVYTDSVFEDKDGAFAYLQDLGLIDIIDEAIGSVILVTPSDGTAFRQADQNIYYKLQTAICAQKAGMMDADGNRISFCDAEYFGGYGYIYAIGIGEGASFLNTYVSSAFDFSSRLAGMLLINGSMEPIRKVASVVPVYLVNPAEDIVEKYRAANETDAWEETAEAITYYNEVRPLQKVVVAKAEHDDAWFINDAYYNMFIKAMRVPVVKAGLYSVATPYQGGSFDEAPYSLCERNAVIDGVTAGGLHLIRRVDDEKFSEFKTEDGEYIQTWFEYLPEDVLNNTAAPGSVPLVLGIHGTGDDPRLYVDEIGLLGVAAHEHIAIVSPEHNALGALTVDIEKYALTALVEYMLEEYPALDASRVYATGYSMGAGSTMKVILASPQLFAASVPMSPVTNLGDIWEPTEDDLAQFADIDLPVLITTSGYDLRNTYDNVNNHILEPVQTLMNRMFRINELPEVEFDFDAYPYSGFVGDKLVYRTLNNEYWNRTWYVEKDGVPMAGLSITEGLIHALYPEYGKLFWDFVKHYSRDLETGEIIYDPYVD